MMCITSSRTFPWSQEARFVLENLKKTISEAVFSTIDEDIPFDIEGDASDIALAAMLN